MISTLGASSRRSIKSRGRNGTASKTSAVVPALSHTRLKKLTWCCSISHEPTMSETA
jgi:hypothetical protein